MIESAHIQSAGQYVNWLGAAIHDQELPKTDKVRASVGCLALAMEHHHAIVELVELKLYGSAFALLRVAFEAYVRGLWLSISARNREVGNFLRNIDPPRIGAMLEQLETRPEFSELVLSRVKRSHWKSMCAYTHTGGLHVQRRNTSEAIEPNYTDDEVKEVLTFAETVGSLAALRIAAIAGDNQLANTILEKFEKRPR